MERKLVLVSILTIRFVFGSDKFSKRYGALACEADSYVMCDLYDSHINWLMPGFGGKPCNK